MGEQNVLVASPIILLGSNCSPCSTGSRAYNTGSVPANLWRQTGHSTALLSDVTTRAGYCPKSFTHVSP